MVDESTSHAYIHLKHSFFSGWNKCPAFLRTGDRGSTVVKEVLYKSEVRWFDP
jgi:hypothetical protein